MKVSTIALIVVALVALWLIMRKRLSGTVTVGAGAGGGARPPGYGGSVTGPTPPQQGTSGAQDFQNIAMGIGSLLPGLFNGIGGLANSFGGGSGGIGGDAGGSYDNSGLNTPVEVGGGDGIDISGDESGY